MALVTFTVHGMKVPKLETFKKISGMDIPLLYGTVCSILKEDRLEKNRLEYRKTSGTVFSRVVSLDTLTKRKKNVRGGNISLEQINQRRRFPCVKISTRKNNRLEIHPSSI